MSQTPRAVSDSHCAGLLAVPYGFSCPTILGRTVCGNSNSFRAESVRAEPVRMIRPNISKRITGWRTDFWENYWLGAVHMMIVIDQTHSSSLFIISKY